MMKKMLVLASCLFLAACGSGSDGGSSSGTNTGVVVAASTGNYVGTYCNNAAPVSTITITRDSGVNGWEGRLGVSSSMGLWNDSNASLYNVGDVVIYKLENGYIRARYIPRQGVIQTSEYARC